MGLLFFFCTFPHWKHKFITWVRNKYMQTTACLSLKFISISKDNIFVEFTWLDLTSCGRANVSSCKLRIFLLSSLIV